MTLVGRSRQTTLCVDASSQTWKATARYTAHTHGRACTHTPCWQRRSETDGETAESREEVEIKVTVSGITIRAQGLIIHTPNE